MNTLYYGDNLDIMREYVPDESVDLIYLDPPFNSKQAYNVIFRDKEGHYPPSQIEAFDDTWHWTDDNEELLVELTKSQYPPELIQMLHAFRSFLGNSDMMSYLVMMAIRLWEMHRVLKPTGSIYLHCDPTASHYLKILMDRIFGVKNFRNEITWKRTSSHSDSKRWGQVHDILLFFSKSKSFKWNRIYLPYDEKYLADFYRFKDKRGRYRLDHIIRSASMGPRPNLTYEYKGYTPEWGWRVVRGKLEALDKEDRIAWSKTRRPYLKRYLEEQKGKSINSVITDIPPLSKQSAEKLGYPTQKPETLLERIIKASSCEGDVVLDPFCGCGTTLAVAEKLGRKWVGIDITILAINLIEKRLRDNFPDVEYDVVGIPCDVPSAEKLASTREGKFLFEHWFVIALGGQPHKSSGGGDKGIDGFLYARDVKRQTHRIIISVKGGSYGPAAVRDLKGVVEREGAAAGLLLALNPPSTEAKGEAASAGRFSLPGVARTYPKVQILTVADYFDGLRPDLPDTSETLKKAPRIKREKGKDQELPLNGSD